MTGDERVTVEASTAEGRPDRGPAYYVDVQGVPDGTIVIRFDPEGRAMLDIGVGEDIPMGMTVHLPHTRDLE